MLETRGQGHYLNAGVPFLQRNMPQQCHYNTTQSLFPFCFSEVIIVVNWKSELFERRAWVSMWSVSLVSVGFRTGGIDLCHLTVVLYLRLCYWVITEWQKSVENSGGAVPSCIIYLQHIPKCSQIICFPLGQSQMKCMHLVLFYSMDLLEHNIFFFLIQKMALKYVCTM